MTHTHPEAVADGVGARLVRVAGYYPHTQQPVTVNAVLRELWGRSAGQSG
ncbi:hypothetical protein [Streptomyces sp. NPDC127119]